MYIVLPLFCVPESWSHIDHNPLLNPFFKKIFIQVCEEKKYEHSSANPLRTGTERFYELL